MGCKKQKIFDSHDIAFKKIFQVILNWGNFENVSWIKKVCIILKCKNRQNFGTKVKRNTSPDIDEAYSVIQNGIILALIVRHALAVVVVALARRSRSLGRFEHGADEVVEACRRLHWLHRLPLSRWLAENVVYQIS